MPSRYGRSFTKYSGLRSSSTICPRVYSFSLNGPVPTQRWRSSASGTWAGYTTEYPDASIRINEGWGRLSRKITVWASGASMASTLAYRSEEHTSELQSLTNLVCRLLLEKKKKNQHTYSKEE